MNHKILGACFCLPITLGPFFAYSSCSKSEFDFIWQGANETFERSGYQKFASSSISGDKILTSYFNNTNFKKMVCQDIIYKMNHEWYLWPSSQVLKYKISTSVQGDRLSWDLQISDQQDNLLLWWTIKKLQFTWLLEGDAPYQQIQIAPKNVTWPSTAGHDYEIDKEFWFDHVFNMVIKHRENKDQPFSYAHEFSYKTTLEEEQYALYEIIKFIVITPFYYDGVIVEEA